MERPKALSRLPALRLSLWDYIIFRGVGHMTHMTSDKHTWPKFATNHVINTWQNEPRVSAASKAHVPRMRLSHVHIVVLFLCNINYHELYKFLFYKISKLHLWYE